MDRYIHCDEYILVELPEEPLDEESPIEVPIDISNDIIKNAPQHGWLERIPER